MTTADKKTEISPFFLKVMPNKMEAFLTVRQNSEPNGISVQMALDYLRDSGITTGIDENAVVEMIKEKKWGEPIRVALGKMPVKGQDGYVEYFFDPNPKITPKVRVDGKVDFRDLSLTQNALPGQKLAKLIPSAPGSPGENIFGEAVPFQKGKPARLLRGKNTSYVDEAKTVLQSDVEGNVKLRKDGFIEVDTRLNVDGDVDLSIGNLDVAGDLVVRSNIKTGFKVMASGNIEVGGVVEDAQMQAGGNILVKGGFLGEGKGVIRAGGDVFLKFVSNQRVDAAGDIHVYEESIQSNLTAGGAIYINKGKGVLVGGVARAGRCAEIKVIGNELYVKTKIAVAERGDIIDRMVQLGRNIADLNKKLKKVEEKIMEVMVQKGHIKNLSEEDKKAFAVFHKLSEEIPKTRDSMTKELHRLEEELRQLKEVSYIKVIDTIYPGISMKLAGYAKEIEEKYGPTTFRAIDAEIVPIFQN